MLTVIKEDIIMPRAKLPGQRHEYIPPGLPSFVVFDYISRTVLRRSFIRVDSLGLKPIPCPQLQQVEMEERDISPSMLGHASTVGDEDQLAGPVHMDDEEASIQHLYRDVRAQDPVDIIVREKVEQKDALLMDGGSMQIDDLHLPETEDLA